MKIFTLTSFLIVLMCQQLLVAQTSDEAKIRELEDLWSEALVNFDTITLQKIWSPYYVINNPAGKVVTGREIIEIMKSGTRYQTHKKTIERITFFDNVAIVMGEEVMLSDDSTRVPPKPRRITNIWMKTNGSWLLIARQASNL
jgi:ketosteroid isomerase-like protein